MIVIAVHQHFGFDHRHDTRFLAQRRVTRQRMAVRFDARAARHVFADGDHRAPLRELRAEARVFVEAFAQAIQTFRDDFARKSRQRLRAFVHFYTRKDAGIEHHFRERHAGLGRLTNGFVVEDRAGNVLAERRRGQQHFAIRAAMFFAVRRY